VAYCLLKPGSEKPIKKGHPWVYAGSLERVEAEGGQVVEVLDHRGRFIAKGHFHPRSPVAIRILTWRREAIDRRFFRRRIEEAFGLRIPLEGITSAMRLVNFEGDLLPGLAIDRYGDYLSVQIHTEGMDRLREMMLGILGELLSFKGIYERSDAEVREREGLGPSEGPLLGEVPEVVEVREGDVRFLVDICRGQKTGFYLDQRENRLLVRRLSEGKKVLDCFCYTGGFSVSALKGGAKEVKAVDSSWRALELLRENVKVNALPQERCIIEKADVFDFLRGDRDRYDLIILDPPPFARSRQEVPQAIKGYVELNRLAMRRLRKGGLLLTCCCTQRVSREEFFGAVLEAGRSSGRMLQVLHCARAPIDHPVLSSHPEGDYFKALLLRVL